jgi:hypothetical protein
LSGRLKRTPVEISYRATRGANGRKKISEIEALASVWIKMMKTISFRIRHGKLDVCHALTDDLSGDLGIVRAPFLRFLT